MKEKATCINKYTQAHISTQIYKHTHTHTSLSLYLTHTHTTTHWGLTAALHSKPKENTTGREKDNHSSIPMSSSISLKWIQEERERGGKRERERERYESHIPNSDKVLAQQGHVRGCVRTSSLPLPSARRGPWRHRRWCGGVARKGQGSGSWVTWGQRPRWCWGRRDGGHALLQCQGCCEGLPEKEGVMKGYERLWRVMKEQHSLHLCNIPMHCKKYYTVVASFYLKCSLTTTNTFKKYWSVGKISPHYQTLHVNTNIWTDQMFWVQINIIHKSAELTYQ